MREQEGGTRLPSFFFSSPPPPPALTFDAMNLHSSCPFLAFKQGISRDRSVSLLGYWQISAFLFELVASLNRVYKFKMRTKIIKLLGPFC